jgi:hypothetical protein
MRPPKYPYSVTEGPWYTGNTAIFDLEGKMTERQIKERVERVQLGVRMEKHLVKVLKGLAEFNGETLGELLEKIVLHSFDPVVGQEGEASASPHGKKALAAIVDLAKIYGMKFDVHSSRRFEREEIESNNDEI